MPGRARSFLRTWRGDENRRLLVSAALSCACTALFALYHGYLGLRYVSLWHGSIGLFYLLLMAIRGSILLTEVQIMTRPEEEQRRRRRPGGRHVLLHRRGGRRGGSPGRRRRHPGGDRLFPLLARTR